VGGLLSEINPGQVSFQYWGNHDYGDYWNWNSAAEKQENYGKAFLCQKQMGFRLLINEWEL
jgi:hypothetical protein